MSSSKKINDLSRSKFRDRFFLKKTEVNSNRAMTIFRVSTKKQERAKDYDDQRDHVDGYVSEKGFEVVESRQFAETASDHARRKYFQEAIDTIRKSHQTDHPIHHLIFAYQSRSTRNKASEQELESLIELGVELHFARDRRVLNKNSDFTQFMIWYMENFRNAQYTEELKKNVVDGICKSMERGMYPSGRPIYGYKSVGRKENRRFEFDGRKSEYMLEAFRLMATGFYQNKSYKKLKKDLDEKFPDLKNTPGAKKLGDMLRNPFYSGDFIYAGEFHVGEPEVHPPLVNRVLWNQVQEILGGKRKTRSGKKDLPYLQLLKCNGRILDENGNLTDQVCGCAITGEEKRKPLKNGTFRLFVYYHCSNTTKRCSQRDELYMKNIRNKLSYRQEEIEKLFEPIFDSILITPELAQKMT
jgi:DNA invertase Pin-like site-specific DNA recombinase